MELQNIFDFIPDTHYNYEKVFPQGYRIRLFECFAGVGMTRMAFNRLQIPYESVGISEIDKYALKSYEAIHGDCNNYGDITKIEELPPCDILTWSFPCTDLSKAGKQAGMVEGTRSNLGWEIIRLVEQSQHKPTVLIMENVVDLVQEKFAKVFWEMRVALEKLGYTNRYQVLNAKDYGVAQNRERVFMVSILGDWYYEFPVRMKLEKRLKDYLEDNVDEKYYLSQKLIKAFENHKNRHSIAGNGFGWKLKSGEEVATTLKAGANTRPEDNFIAEPLVNYDSRLREAENTKWNNISPTLGAHNYAMPHFVAEPSIAIPEATERGFAIAHEGDGVYVNRPHQKRGCVQKGMIQTIKTSAEDVGVVVSEPSILTPRRTDYGKEVRKQYESGELKESRHNMTQLEPRFDGTSNALTTVLKDNLLATTSLRIRKLTPIETWRLMGIDDDDFHKAQAMVSNSQLYKQAGNGLVVDVFAGILKGLAEEPRKGKE